MSDKLKGQESEIAARILKEINERLGLVNVGLSYLSMARNSGTLSGGESQRIRLASQIGSGLTGVLYVLDEPSIGLHQRDNDRLLATLVRLRDLGNTVLVVEHDEDSIRLADYVIDMGPGAGVHGGKVVAAGTPEQIISSKDSLTAGICPARWKSAYQNHGAKRKRALCGLRMQAATIFATSVDFPLGVLTCVTGVSGGGTTLVLETLWKGLRAFIRREMPAPHRAITDPNFSTRLSISTSSTGRTPRSNPATYTGHSPRSANGSPAFPRPRRAVMPRALLLQRQGRAVRGVPGRRLIKIEMHFDVMSPAILQGARYNRETLEIAFRGKSMPMFRNDSRRRLTSSRRCRRSVKSWKRCTESALAMSALASRRQPCRAAKHSA